MGGVGYRLNGSGDIGWAGYGFSDDLVSGAGRGASAPDCLFAFADDFVLNNEIRGGGSTDNPAVLIFKRTKG